MHESQERFCRQLLRARRRLVLARVLETALTGAIAGSLLAAAAVLSSILLPAWPLKGLWLGSPATLGVIPLCFAVGAAVASIRGVRLSEAAWVLDHRLKASQAIITAQDSCARGLAGVFDEAVCRAAAEAIESNAGMSMAHQSRPLKVRLLLAGLIVAGGLSLLGPQEAFSGSGPAGVPAELTIAAGQSATAMPADVKAITSASAAESNDEQRLAAEPGSEKQAWTILSSRPSEGEGEIADSFARSSGTIEKVSAHEGMTDWADSSQAQSPLSGDGGNAEQNAAGDTGSATQNLSGELARWTFVRQRAAGRKAAMQVPPRYRQLVHVFFQRGE